MYRNFKNLKKDIKQINYIKTNIEKSNHLDKSDTIEKYGYTYFKPNIKNKQQNINYDIVSESEKLIRESELHDKYKNLVNKKINNTEVREFNNILNQISEKDNSSNKKQEIETDCHECIQLFSKEIQKSYNYKNFKNNIENIKDEITNYYKLLQKSYLFDYMVDPSIENKNKIKKLNNCYNDLIKGKCYKDNDNISDLKKDTTIINLFKKFENNLEKINILLNI